jgi:hypothetical protein
MAQPGERENLLTATQVPTKLRYNDRRLLEIVGGRDAMIESSRLPGLAADLARITNEHMLTELVKWAVRCLTCAAIARCQADEDALGDFATV